MKDYPYPMQARNEALCPFTRDTQLSGFLTLPKSLLCWGSPRGRCWCTACCWTGESSPSGRAGRTSRGGCT
ncbi:MAG: hypothetical protein ACLR1T_17630 [Evtepia gabavorous]